MNVTGAVFDEDFLHRNMKATQNMIKEPAVFSTKYDDFKKQVATIQAENENMYNLLSPSARESKTQFLQGRQNMLSHKMKQVIKND